MKNLHNSALKAFALFVPALLLFSCGGKIGKMIGKWQITDARAYVAQLDTMLSQVLTLESKTYYGSDDMKKYKKLEDSVRGMRSGIENLYKATTYQFNSDGSVDVQTPKNPYKATWKLLEGKDYFVISIEKDGKEIEAWKLYNDEFETVPWKNEKKVNMEINDGESFDNSPQFLIKCDAKKME